MSRVLPEWQSSFRWRVLPRARWVVPLGSKPGSRAFWHHTIARLAFFRGLRRRAFQGAYRLEPNPEVGSDKGKKYGGDDAVHGEEGGIEAAQVARGNQRVFIGQEQGHSPNAQPADDLEVEKQAEPDEQGEHGQVHDAGGDEGSGDADGLGQAVKAGGAVVLEVLAGVE